MKFIIALGLIAFIAVVHAEDFKCKQGVPYQENECNSCFCSENGNLGCTLMACVSHSNKVLTGCEVGTSWPKECNTCYCVKDLGTLCEVKKC